MLAVSYTVSISGMNDELSHYPISARNTFLYTTQIPEQFVDRFIVYDHNVSQWFETTENNNF